MKRKNIKSFVIIASTLLAGIAIGFFSKLNEVAFSNVVFGLLVSGTIALLAGFICWATMRYLISQHLEDIASISGEKLSPREVIVHTWKSPDGMEKIASWWSIFTASVVLLAFVGELALLGTLAVGYLQADLTKKQTDKIHQTMKIQKAVGLVQADLIQQSIEEKIGDASEVLYMIRAAGYRTNFQKEDDHHEHNKRKKQAFLTCNTDDKCSVFDLGINSYNSTRLVREFFREWDFQLRKRARAYESAASLANVVHYYDFIRDAVNKASDTCGLNSIDGNLLVKQANKILSIEKMLQRFLENRVADYKGSFTPSLYDEKFLFTRASKNLHFLPEIKSKSFKNNVGKLWGRQDDAITLREIDSILSLKVENKENSEVGKKSMEQFGRILVQRVRYMKRLYLDHYYSVDNLEKLCHARVLTLQGRKKEIEKAFSLLEKAD